MGAMPLQHEYDYPESDGQPMAETTVHWKVMVETTQALVRWYEKTQDVWVGSNLFLYYEKDKPGIAPDVLAVRGVAKWDRRTYKVWEEGGHVPFFVLEATSKDTKSKDTGHNKLIYQDMGVAEYFLFDPLNEYLKPRLQGFELTARGYTPIPRLADGSLPSKTAGLLLRGEGTRLRLINAATGEPLLWLDEVEAARQEAEERAGREAAARQAAEAAQQAAEAAQRAAEAAQRTAEAAQKAAEERVEGEAAARRAVEEELARLRGDGHPPGR
jgi:Uma2 family endonuclease